MKRFFKRWWPILGLVIIGLLLTAGYFVYRLNLRPVNRSLPTPVAISIDKGARVPTIAKQLEANGVVRSRWAFQVYVTIHGLRRKIEAGYYELSPADSTATNAKIIARGIVVNKAFLVPEGATEQKIEANAAVTWLRGAELPAAMSDSYPNAFLTTRPAGSTLEGYLFPDTYEIAPTTTPHELIQAMLNNFGAKVTPQIIAGFAKQGLSLHQGLTLASVVQSEVSKPADQPTVAQIFLKRLSIGMMLESDVTANYGATQLGITSYTDISSIRSPYNTYLHTGLPPGPICNPGITAIEAVANPSTTSYLYFIADKQGNTHYATTLAEHQANVAKYLNQ